MNFPESIRVCSTPRAFPKHLTRVFVERDESHFMPVVEMGELIDLRSAELGKYAQKTEVADPRR